MSTPEQYLNHLDTTSALRQGVHYPYFRRTALKNRYAESTSTPAVHGLAFWGHTAYTLFFWDTGPVVLGTLDVQDGPNV